MSERSLVDEILAKHGHSRQPESVQLCAVLKAVLEVIKAEGLDPSPTALYGALMTALEKPETRGSAEVRMR
jgi:ribosomal RNA-processing protein 12